jgi:hypothetical protein
LLIDFNVELYWGQQEPSSTLDWTIKSFLIQGLPHRVDQLQREKREEQTETKTEKKSIHMHQGCQIFLDT